MPTPVRSMRAGVVLFVTFLSLTACRDRGEPAPQLLVIGTDTIVLPDTIRLIEVSVGADAGFEPSTPMANTGDIVRFGATDGRTHAVTFQGSALGAAHREFLESTGQLRAPPLLAEGAAWIISLEGAPPGEYPFTCLTHGSVGVLTVRQRPSR